MDPCQYNRCPFDGSNIKFKTLVWLSSSMTMATNNWNLVSRIEPCFSIATLENEGFKSLTLLKYQVQRKSRKFQIVFELWSQIYSKRKRSFSACISTSARDGNKTLNPLISCLISMLSWLHLPIVVKWRESLWSDFSSVIWNYLMWTFIK